MHVLFIPSWYPLNAYDLNGCFFREQAHAISRLGYKTGVIIPQFRSLRLGTKAVFGQYQSEAWYDSKVTTYFKHNVFFFPRVPYLDQYRWIKDGMQLFEEYINEQGIPDIIHVQSMLLAGSLALEIFKKHDIPYCITEHSTTFSRGLVPQWQYNYLTKVVKNSKYCMAVSHELGHLLEHKFIGSQWHFLPNLLDNLFLENTNISNKKKLFCAVATLSEKKAIDVLVKAFTIVIKEHPDYELVIGGDGPKRQKLEQLTKHLDVENAVTFLGALNRTQVRDLMAKSFCYVLSSHVETFGVVVIEALSQGTPVVSTRCGGPESILTSKEDGILVEVNDPAALAQGMLKVIEDIDSYDSKIIRGRCIDRFSEQAFTAKIAKIYQQCVTKSL